MASEFRQADLADLPDIVRIIDEAKAFLKREKLDQWQQGYPAEADIKKDIEKGFGHVLTVDNELAAYIAVIFGEEPAYTIIKNGRFSNDSRDYVTTHRIAVADKFRGQGWTKALFQGVYQLGQDHGYHDFRVDTLAENTAMRHVFLREGYVERGLVIINGERIAYQKEIK